MSQQLINHSPDLKRLWDEGFEMEVKGGFLLVHHVPYLNSSGEIKYGVLVSTLTLAGEMTFKPDTHVAYFVGEAPCHKDRRRMDHIINSSGSYPLIGKVVANHYLSSKPAAGYADYYEKMSTYVNILSAPAVSVDDTVTARTSKVITVEGPEATFRYADSNSARARIDTVSAKLKGLKVAIVGLGGTGSYILDLVAKTPVEAVQLFDGDTLLQHNAFRAPGAPSVEKLLERMKKVDYFREIYSNMHLNITAHSQYVDASNVTALSSMDFVFLCLDRGEAKAMIIDYLYERNIPFIDVGIGIQRVEDALLGDVRVTTGTSKKKDHIKKRIPLVDEAENEYNTNIQIADLNALNATLAVIKWKKLFGFYQDFEQEHHSTYSINVNMLLSEDRET